ncbi:MAG: hypothetical protein ACLFPA_09610 [Dichotomicrobium sp.]
MTSKKKLLIGALAAVLIGGLAGTAEAGGKRGHFGFKFHGPKYSYGYHHRGYYHGCYWLKKKYFRTGHYHWLKKYKRCRYGY